MTQTPVTATKPAAGALAPARRPPLLLRAVAFSLFFFPSSMVIEPFGATGTVPLLLSLGLFVLWAASWIFGLHDPIPFRHPGRIGITLLLLGSCVAYVALFTGWSADSTPVTRDAADRWLLLLVASTALILVTAETVRTMDDAMVLVRSILAGGFFCCVVAVIQFVFHINPMEWIQSAMPGFVYNGGDNPFQARGALIRVAGSTFTQIELAVVCAMLLPLSVWRGLFDTKGPKWLHWLGTALLAFSVAVTISRSGTLGVAVAMVVFLPFLPALARKWALVTLPVAAAGLFLTVPGLMSTLFGALTADRSDTSISTRTNNYPRVVAMLDERPIVGLGPGNYMPSNALFILDNQYLNALVTMGLLGLVCTIAYFVLPGLGALHAARTAKSIELRALAGAVAAGSLVAAVCSVTFDSLSFPIFALLYPLLVGLGGAAWLLVRQEQPSPVGIPPQTRSSSPTPSVAKKGGHKWTR